MSKPIPFPAWLRADEPSPCGTAMGGPCNRELCLACDPLRARLRAFGERKLRQGIRAALVRR